MKFSPDPAASRERFWLLVLGTLVLTTSLFIADCGGAWLATRIAGEWLGMLSVLSTLSLGVYSVVLLYRGRIFPAFIGGVIFLFGTLCNLPAL